MPEVSLNYVWSTGNRLGPGDNSNKIFTSDKTFYGKQFKILALPEGRILQGTYLTEEEAKSVTIQNMADQYRTLF